MRRFPLLLVGVLVAGGLLVVPGVRTAAAPVPVVAVPLAAAPAAAPSCFHFNGMGRYNHYDDVVHDRLGVRGFPATRVGNGQGDIDWTADPHRSVSWRMWLHSLTWLSDVHYMARHGNRHALRRFAAVVRDWDRDNSVTFASGADPAVVGQATMRRTEVLLCLRRLTGPLRWLDDLVTRHAEHLMTHYSGAWNHGLDEDIALLGVGCLLHRPRYVDRARTRLGVLAATVVDAQGVSNEQSVGYHFYSYDRLGAAVLRLQECGYPLPEPLRTRRALMPAFSAAATDPRGEMWQIGDTESGWLPSRTGTETEYVASLGRRGPRPAQRVSVYSAGYVFGRSGWGERRPYQEESAYSIRFGPARAIHGHDDRMSVTYYAYGRLLLTDPGNLDYEPGAMRDYARSPAAHNLMTVAGMPGLGRAPVALVRRVTTPGWDAFGLVSDAVGGVRLRRDVLVLRGPDLLAVYDRTDLPRAAAATQRWHLPPDLAVTVQGRGRAVASDGDTKLVLVSIRLDGAARDLATVRGSRHPPQGFVFPSLRVAVPADMVSLTTTARRVRMLTMAIPAAQAAQVDARVVAAANGARHVAVRVGTQVVHIVVARDGSLSRA